MRKKLEIIIFLFLVGIILFFSTFRLTESPSVWYDEGIYFQTAANLANQGIAGMQFAPGYIDSISHQLTVGYPLIYLLALWFKIFGASIIAGRSLMVLFMLGLLIVSFILSKRLFGTKPAIGTLALLTTFPPLYGNGKSILGEVPGLFYLALFLLCFNLARASISRKMFWFIIAGICAGLAIVTKPIFLLLLPAIVIGVIVEWKRGGMGIREVLGAAGAGVLPIITWLFVQFQPGDSLKSVLSYYANPSDMTNILQAVLANVRNLFTDLGPLFLVGMMIVWLVSLWLRRKNHKSIRTEEIISIAFSLLVIAAYPRTAGWYRYLFPAQIISLVFSPYALLVIAEQVTLVWKQRALILIFTLLAGLGAYQTMFNSWVAEAYGSRKTAFWQEYFEKLPDSISIFFYDTPEVAMFDRSSNYYQYLQPAGGDIGTEELDTLIRGIPDMVIMKTGVWKDQYPYYTIQKEVYKYTILVRKS